MLHYVFCMKLESPVTRKDWKAFLKKTPLWVLLLIIVMLSIRFVITGIFHLLAG